MIQIGKLLAALRSLRDVALLASFVTACKSPADYIKACDERDLKACARICKKEGVSNGRCVAYFEDACDHDDADGCLIAAEAYKHGLGVEPDVEKAFVLQVRGCEKGSASLCEILGKSYMLKEDWANAETYYRRLCQLRPPGMCAELDTLAAYRKVTQELKASHESLQGTIADGERKEAELREKLERAQQDIEREKASRATSPR